MTSQIQKFRSNIFLSIRRGYMEVSPTFLYNEKFYYCEFETVYGTVRLSTEDPNKKFFVVCDLCLKQSAPICSDICDLCLISLNKKEQEVIFEYQNFAKRRKTFFTITKDGRVLGCFKENLDAMIFSGWRVLNTFHYNEKWSKGGT